MIGETQADHDSVTVYFSSLKSCLKTIVYDTLRALYHFINRSLKVFKTITVILKLSQKIENDKIKLL